MSDPQLRRNAVLSAATFIRHDLAMTLMLYLGCDYTPSNKPPPNDANQSPSP